MEGKFLTRLVSIDESSTIQSTSTKDSITINRPSTSKDRPIEGISDDSNEIDNDVGIVDTNRMRTIKYKDLVKAEADFFTFGARFVFTELRQAFTKASILHHFNPECYIWVELMY